MAASLVTAQPHSIVLPSMESTSRRNPGPSVGGFEGEAYRPTGYLGFAFCASASDGALQAPSLLTGQGEPATLIRTGEPLSDTLAVGRVGHRLASCVAHQSNGEVPRFVTPDELRHHRGGPALPRFEQCFPQLGPLVPYRHVVPLVDLHLSP
jgi:hypothetical protein